MQCLYKFIMNAARARLNVEHELMIKIQRYDFVYYMLFAIINIHSWISVFSVASYFTLMNIPYCLDLSCFCMKDTCKM